MVDTLRIKRRLAGGAAGAPAALKNAEIAFNEQDNTLYYGKGDSSGNATSIIAIGGDAKADKSYVDSTFALISHTHVAANITDFSEAVDDRVGALLVAGTNITLTYNDAAGSLTIAAAGSGGVTDGDKGDIVVSGGGTSWMFDSTVVTTAGRALLDDASAAAQLVTLGAVAKIGDTMTGLLTISANTATLPAPMAGTLLHIGQADGTTPRFEIDAFGAAQAQLVLRRANGTAASPLALGSGDSFGSLAWFGRGATAYSAAARSYINSVTTEAWSDTAQGSALVFGTTTNGTLTTVERMRIDNNGAVTIPGSLTGTGAFAFNGGTFSGAVVMASPSGDFKTRATLGTIAAANYPGNLALEVLGGPSAGDASMIAFHRPMMYGGYFGLDTDNQWKVGGWSMGAVSYRLVHEGLTGIITLAGDLSITKASPIFRLNKSASGQAATIVGSGPSLVQRWAMELGSTDAEDGVAANAGGSSFILHRYRNDGAYLGAAININRATGAMTVNGTIGFAGGTLTGQLVTFGSSGSIANGAIGAAGIQVVGASGQASFINFHRPGAYAANLGIDTDNNLRYGGVSAGANNYLIYHSGNFTPGNYVVKAGDTMTGQLTVNNGAGSLSGTVYLGANGGTRYVHYDTVRYSFGGGAYNSRVAKLMIPSGLFDSIDPGGASIGLRAADDASGSVWVGYSNNATYTSGIRALGQFESYNNSYGSTSDRRLKTNITPATSKLEDVMRVPIINFEFNTSLREAFGKQIGVADDDIAAIFPSLVYQTPITTPVEVKQIGTVTEDGKELILTKETPLPPEGGYNVVKSSILFGPILMKAFQEFVTETRQTFAGMRAEIAELKAARSV